MHTNLKWKYLATSQYYSGVSVSLRDQSSPIRPPSDERATVHWAGGGTQIKPKLKIIIHVTYHPHIRGPGVFWRGGVRSPMWGAGDCCSRRRDGDNASLYSVGQYDVIEDRNLRCRSWKCWCGEEPVSRHRERDGTYRNITGAHYFDRVVNCSNVTWFETPGIAIEVFSLVFVHCLDKEFYNGTQTGSVISHENKLLLINPTYFWKILTMMYNTQNYWVLGLCPSSGILETRKHNVSENWSFPVLRWLNSCSESDRSCPVIEVSSF
jgi:hypothetical protein